MGYKYLPSLCSVKYIARIKERMRCFKRICAYSMPMTDDEKRGVYRSSGISTESDIGRNIAMQTTGVRFWSCGTVGYGPTSNQGGDIQCDHDAGFVRE